LRQVMQSCHFSNAKSGMTPSRFRTGIELLLVRRPSLLRGRKLGVLSHSAAVDAAGRSTVQLLIEGGFKVAALFGPEHGFFGQAPAGQAVATTRHPAWNIPIVSLYGAQRKPSPSALHRIEVLLMDMQDLAVRTYTYVSTLAGTLRAAAAAGIRVIVADRPVPFGAITDGPMLDPSFSSFVGAVETPLVYGMTPAETAIWLKQRMIHNADIVPAPMEGWNRRSFPGDPLRPWTPPSPGIRSRESALCYPATVFGEAIPSIDIGRGTLLPFQLFGAPWARSRQLMERLQDAGTPGVAFAPHAYLAEIGRHKGRLIDGVRMVVTDPAAYRPAFTAVTIIHVLQEIVGRAAFWRDPELRSDFFDKLMGTDRVRVALMNGESPAAIAGEWEAAKQKFLADRRKALLYQA